MCILNQFYFVVKAPWRGARLAKLHQERTKKKIERLQALLSLTLWQSLKKWVMWATGPGQTKVSTQTGIALQGLVPGYVTNVAKVDEKKTGS